MSGSRQHNATPSVASRLQHKLWKPPKHAEQESDRERSRNRAAKITQDLAAQSRKRSSTYPYAVELSSSAVPGPSARVVTQPSSSGRDQQHASSSSTHHQPRPQRVATAPTPLSQGTSQSQATRSNLEVPDSRGYLSRRTQQTPMSSTEQISGGEGSSWSSNRVPVPVGKNNPTTQSAHPAPSAPTATKTMWNMFSQSSRSAGPSKPRDSAQEERAKKEKAREERRAKEERARQERMDEEKARLEYYARAKAEAEYAAQVKKAEKATRAATSSKRVDTPEQKEYDSSPNGQRHRGDDALSTRHGRSGSGSVQPTPLQAISTASQAAASRSANPAPSSSQPYQQPFPSTSAQQSGQVSGRDAAGARHTTSSSQAFHQAQALASSSAQSSAPVPSRDDTRQQSTSNGQAFHQSLATAYSQQTGASSGHDANRHRSVSASAQPPITLPPISSASQAFQNFASRPSAPPLTPATGVSTASQANYASRPAAPGLSSQAGVSAAQANYLAASRNGPAAAVQIASSTANDEQSGGRHRSVSASATTSVQPGVTLPPISVASRAYQQAVSRSTTVPPTSTTQTYQHPAPVAPVQNATDISSTRHNRSDSTSVQPGSTLTAMSTASQVYQQPTSRNASGAPQSSHGYQYPQPSVPVGAAQMTGEVPHTRHTRSDSTSVQPGSTLTALSTASQAYQSTSSRGVTGLPTSASQFHQASQAPQPHAVVQEEPSSSRRSRAASVSAQPSMSVQHSLISSQPSQGSDGSASRRNRSASTSQVYQSSTHQGGIQGHAHPQPVAQSIAPSSSQRSGARSHPSTPVPAPSSGLAAEPMMQSSSHRSGRRSRPTTPVSQQQQALYVTPESIAASSSHRSGRRSRPTTPSQQQASLTPPGTYRSTPLTASSSQRSGATPAPTYVEPVLSWQPQGTGEPIGVYNANVGPSQGTLAFRETYQQNALDQRRPADTPQRSHTTAAHQSNTDAFTQPTSHPWSTSRHREDSQPQPAEKPSVEKHLEVPTSSRRPTFSESHGPGTSSTRVIIEDNVDIAKHRAHANPQTSSSSAQQQDSTVRSMDPRKAPYVEARMSRHIEPSSQNASFQSRSASVQPNLNHPSVIAVQPSTSSQRSAIERMVTPTPASTAVPRSATPPPAPKLFPMYLPQGDKNESSKQIEKDAMFREKEHEKAAEREYVKDVERADREREKDEGKDRRKGRESEQREKESSSRPTHRSRGDRVGGSLPINNMDTSGSETETSKTKDSRHNRSTSDATILRTATTPGLFKPALFPMSPMGNALPLLNPELLSQRAPWANPTAQLVTIHAGQGPPDRTASRASYRAPSVAPEYVSSRTPKPYEKGHSTQHDGNTRSQTVPQGRNESSAQAAYAAQSKPVPNLFAHAVPDKVLTDKQEHSKRMSTFLSPPSFNPPEITPTHSSSSSVPTERFQSTAASPPPILTNEQQSLWGSLQTKVKQALKVPLTVSRNSSSNSQEQSTSTASANGHQSSKIPQNPSAQNPIPPAPVSKSSHPVTGISGTPSATTEQQTHRSTTYDHTSRHEITSTNQQNNERYPQSSSYQHASLSSHPVNRSSPLSQQVHAPQSLSAHKSSSHQSNSNQQTQSFGQVMTSRTPSQDQRLASDESPKGSGAAALHSSRSQPRGGSAKPDESTRDHSSSPPVIRDTTTPYQSSSLRVKGEQKPRDYNPATLPRDMASLYTPVTQRIEQFESKAREHEPTTRATSRNAPEYQTSSYRTQQEQSSSRNYESGQRGVPNTHTSSAQPSQHIEALSRILEPTPQSAAARDAQMYQSSRSQHDERPSRGNDQTPQPITVGSTSYRSAGDRSRPEDRPSRDEPTPQPGSRSGYKSQPSRGNDPSPPQIVREMPGYTSQSHRSRPVDPPSRSATSPPEGNSSGVASSRYDSVGSPRPGQPSALPQATQVRPGSSQAVSSSTGRPIVQPIPLVPSSKSTSTRVAVSGHPSTPAPDMQSGHRTQTNVSSSPDSNDEMILMTPSSLAPTLKGGPSQQSFPVYVERPDDTKKRNGLFSLFRSSSKPGSSRPHEILQPQTPTPGSSQRRESVSKPGARSSSAPPVSTEPPSRTRDQPRKVTKPPPTKPPPIVIPPTPTSAPPKPVGSFKLFSKKNHRVSLASLDACDGTANNTVVGSPRSSMRSSSLGPGGPPSPPFRDPGEATRDWRNKEERAAHDLGNRRRRRPGVTFDVAHEDVPTEKPRPTRARAREPKER